MPQVGLLGGSFDPVHLAHIAMARAACQALQLSYVELLPVGQPWQRGRLSASPEHRLAMLKLACGDDPQLRINPIELQRPGATYTIDTLTALPRTARYTWILGSDQLANFCTWHRWRDILQHVRLAVVQRPGSPLEPPMELAQALAPEGLVRIPLPPQDVSASAIRQALTQGCLPESQLDPLVLGYIRTHQLYQRPALTPDSSRTP
ncbi:nicotinate (nicotinamide) nucleotide adenylyltransferase [Castellaniella sp.]|uniref:nicotinate (nicotinamide) nucleotide adenylyltransferase n=1 Tax=Castellaniella sp. TaxID=1955812 RepID=UPI003A4C605D